MGYVVIFDESNTACRALFFEVRLDFLKYPLLSIVETNPLLTLMFIDYQRTRENIGFQEDRFRVELDHVDTAGVTAIMVAVNAGSKHLVAGLVSQGASLSQVPTHETLGK